MKTALRRLTAASTMRGLSLIELMIAIAMGMVIVGALLALYLNVTRTNNEMAKMNRQIENGRFAIQLIQDDVAHAGYWGTYTPQFDDLTNVIEPADPPTALPDPCLAYPWTPAHVRNLVGIPVQGYEAAPVSCGFGNQQANTDVLVVRHAQGCVAGVGTCEPDTAGKVYFQSSLCEQEITAIAQQPNTATTIKLNAATPPGDYTGMVIRIVGGVGAGQSARISAYDAATKIATVTDVCSGSVCTGSAASWTTIPDNSSVYTFGGYVLSESGHTLHQRDCTTLADKRKFVSNIYYIRDFAVTAGDGIPTLVRSSFDNTAQQGGVALIEGIQGFRVEYGVDNVSDAGAAVDNSVAVTWANPMSRTSPTNRGDGVADGAYVRPAALTCASAASCDAANVVAVKIYVLARSLEPTPGYVDTKTYQLGSAPALGPFNDNFKRHVFSTTVRLVNPAGRRDTP